MLTQHASTDDLARFDRHATLLTRLAGLESVQPLPASTKAPPAAAAMVGELTLLVPMAGLIEPQSELQRLDKRLQKLDQELGRCRQKLGNAEFVRNAPPEVVTQERDRLAEFERTRLGLARQIEQVRGLL